MKKIQIQIHVYNSATYLQFIEYKFTKDILIEDTELKNDRFNMIDLIKFLISYPGH